MSLERLSSKQVKALHQMVPHGNASELARRIGVAKQTFYRALSGCEVSSGTVALIERFLQREAQRDTDRPQPLNGNGRAVAV